jgi:hypothetical protein
MKPRFVVVGAARSGTTSLYAYLRGHPGIFMPPVKELNHFIRHPTERSLLQGPDVTYRNACRSRKAYWSVFENAPEGSVPGEIAHIYLYAAESPAMIRDALGTPRIIAVIRNPIQRACSQYRFFRKLGLEPLATFEEALAREPERFRAGWDPMYYYIGRGFYGKQLARYYRIFPRSHIRVYKFEDFFRNPAAGLADLYGFVGAEPTFLPDISRKYLPLKDPRKRGLAPAQSDGVPGPVAVEGSTLRMLRDTYADDIRETESLTGLDLTDWFH